MPYLDTTIVTTRARSNILPLQVSIRAIVCCRYSDTYLVHLFLNFGLVNRRKIAYSAWQYAVLMRLWDIEGAF